MPCKQYRLINKDGVKIATYCGRTLDGVARNSHLRTDNYFYYNCLTGELGPCSNTCDVPAASTLLGRQQDTEQWQGHGSPQVLLVYCVALTRVPSESCAGRFPRDNCPSYLQPQHFAALKAGGLDRLEIHTSTFMEQLEARKFSKVRPECFCTAQHRLLLTYRADRYDCQLVLAGLI